MPNGVGEVDVQDVGAERRPQDDRDREDQRDQEAVAHVAGHVGHRHAGVAAVAASVGVLGPLDRVRVGIRRRVAHRVADVAGDRAAGAVVAAVLHPGAQVLH